jgi:subtilisin family serine protease
MCVVLRFIRALVPVLLALVLAAPVAGAGSGAVGRYIVVLRDGADSAAIASEHAARHGASVSHVYRAALRGYAATIPEARLAAVRSDPRVAFVSVDAEVHAVDQTLPTGVERIEADHSTKFGAGVNVGVAIIDTGIDIDHPDLNVVGGKNCVQGRPTYDDGNGHGTHVAGTVAAKNNGIGAVGVAPGAPLYAVRVLNNAGSGTWSSVICGIDWVTANAASKGIKVANMSLGGSGSDGGCSSEALHQAICNSVAAGVTYVVAAGNSNTDFKGFVPAAYDEVLTVTAMADFDGQPDGGATPTCRTDVDETAADFSNFTATDNTADQAHTIAAPGVCILSTWKGGGYNTISGTSMASPHIAGTAALCLSTIKCSGMTPAQVRTQLRDDAAAQPASYGFIDDPNSPNGNRYYGDLVYAGGY